MSLITANFLGRFGNQAMQYLFARAYAEQHGCEFQCEPWIGQRIFELNDKRIECGELPRRSELDLKDGEVNINLRGYAQHQKCMIYTRQQVRSWFKWRPEIAQMLEQCRSDGAVLAHRRSGDYLGYNYPVVSKASYWNACKKFGLDAEALEFVSDDHPGYCPGIHGELDFVPDFYRLTQAKVLLRGNSTFSWVAALLCNGEVYSPVIEGLEGGKEHDCEFVKGNHPRFCNLHFVTDLYEAVHGES